MVDADSARQWGAMVAERLFRLEDGTQAPIGVKRSFTEAEVADIAAQSYGLGYSRALGLSPEESVIPPVSA
jgi:hypothetical protein